ncbi:pyridoxamine 5'-phosphate oxidase family protein [Ochrobactrum sp. BTU1]|uniref:pyridoxamine 5'-phosphate oxidase family protein n=1 Tax=Ochrobactrum sp. BTU1 TaxID=2840456 RepID=UPI001C04DDFE|nr:pyridoxamine 5'-phosphate oxidase family protein [Ochrobactrum sp. BTU1]
MPITPHHHKIPVIESDRGPKLAYELIRSSNIATICTLDSETGYPLCSLVNMAAHYDGRPLFYFSNLSLHTRNILVNPKVSLLISPSGSSELPRTVRISLVGQVDLVEDDGGDFKRRYIEYNPQMASYPTVPGFHFFVMTIEAVHLIDGAGGPTDINVSDLINSDRIECESLEASIITEKLGSRSSLLLNAMVASRNISNNDNVELVAVRKDGMLLRFGGKHLFLSSDEALDSVDKVLDFVGWFG